MKKLMNITVVLALLMTALISCDKDFKMTAVPIDLSNAAYLKIVHTAPSVRSMYNHPDSFNVFVNNQKVNGAFLTFNGLFPSSTNTYVAVPSGNQDIRLAVHGSATNPDSVTIVSVQKTLEAGEYYTFFITDSLSMPRDSSQIFVRDELPVNVLPGFYSMRFVHAVLNDTANSNVDIFSARRNSVIFPNVKPGTITNFTSLASYQGASDTLIVKRTGTNFELARLNNISLGNQRVYTLTYRGHADSLSTKKYGRGLLLTTNR